MLLDVYFPNNRDEGIPDDSIEIQDEIADLGEPRTLQDVAAILGAFIRTIQSMRLLAQLSFIGSWMMITIGVLA